MALSSKERVARAMLTGCGRSDSLPDRVPAFCQLAIGHYFINSGLDPFDIWFRSEAFADALMTLQTRYAFDGILVNLPGRDPDLERHMDRLERGDEEDLVRWKNGNYTRIPHDDNPHYYQHDGQRWFPKFEEVDPDDLYYVEPWDLTEITYPYTWGFEKEPRPFDSYFPEHHLDTLKKVIETVGDHVSVHGEVFSPFAQFLELLNYQEALLALMDDPAKARACLDRLTEGAADQAMRQAALGPSAILISDAFAGAGFLSPRHYEDFVMPFERKLISLVHAAYPEMPMYTHTCGAIGDRLDLMLATGTQGIDTLDPPPLGTVELDEAKVRLSGKAFIKGNLDPVNVLLQGDPAGVREDATRKIRIGMAGGGYILSTACSVAPATPPENIAVLAEVAEMQGRY